MKKEKRILSIFSLEKAKYNAKTCYEMITDDKKEINNPYQILEEQRKYYSELYKKDEDVDFTLQNTRGIVVPDSIRETQDKQITTIEIENAIKRMNNNKTLGDDGIPKDFYKVFWAKLKAPCYQMVMEAYSEKPLHQTARQGILNLIPKAGKDTRYVKNLKTNYIVKYRL